MFENTKYKYSFKDFFVVFFLIFPIISRWLLPSSLEYGLTKSILNIPIFLPNILFIFFIFIAKRNRRNHRLKIIFLLHFFVAIVGIIINEYTDKLAFIVSGMNYFYAIFLALFYRITESQKLILRKVLFITLLILFLEVILYSTGVLTYSLDITSGYEFGGIYRISTTVAAATGTAGLIFLLGCLVLYMYGKTFLGYLSFILTSISIFLLISRGAIAALILFALLYFWNDVRRSFKKFVVAILLLGAFITIMYNMALFDPFISRMEILNYEGDLSTGRVERIEHSLSAINESGNYLFGVGTGNVFFSKDFKILNLKRKYPGSPHNSYVLTYIEQGLFGILFFILFWILLLHTIRHNKSLFYTLISFVAILFNTETVFIVESEFVFFLSVVIMLALENKELKN